MLYLRLLVLICVAILSRCSTGRNDTDENNERLLRSVYMVDTSENIDSLGNNRRMQRGRSQHTKHRHHEHDGQVEQSVEPSQGSVLDMAILIAYFNPIGYVRTTMNVLYVINKLRGDGFPVYVAEVSLQGKQFTLSPSQRQLSVKTDSVLFYKENIFNMLEKSVPVRYKKIALIDCDVEFENSAW